MLDTALLRGCTQLLSAEDAEPAKGIKVERLDGYKGRAPGMIRCTTNLWLLRSRNTFYAIFVL